MSGKRIPSPVASATAGSINFCLWITGLPGSGKSTIAALLVKLLGDSGIETVTLNLDSLRTVLTPEPTYTEEERNLVYRALALMAHLLVKEGKRSVIIDATGNRRVYRGLARRLIPEFAEVFVKCPLEVCRDREAARRSSYVEQDLYGKAKAGRLKGGLPGVSAPYEVPNNPEVELASAVLDSRESAERIMAYVQSRWLS